MSTLQNTVRLLRHFKRNEGGNFAIIGGLMLVPIIATAGAALDYSQAYNIKSKLQSGADSATLAAARDANSINEFYSLTEAYLAANNPDLKLEITPKTGPKSAEVAVRYRYPTNFLAMVGIEEIPVEVEAEVAVQKFNRSNYGQRSSAGSGQTVAGLKALRDKLLQAVGNLPPRDQEQARRRIRQQFARLIARAEQGTGRIKLIR